MIVAAGLTPAWQQILCFDHFQLETVNRARESTKCASGKSVNVAVMLGQLGGPCCALAPIGGPQADAFRTELSDLGVRGEWVETEAPTRSCTTLVCRGSGSVTELVQEPGPLSAAELQRFVDTYAQVTATARVVTLSGSLPPGAPPTLYRDLVARVGVPVVLDAQGEALLAALAARPAFVKPNRHELATTLGRSIESDADLRSAMIELQRRGARWVVVSDGPRTVWVHGKSGFYHVTPPAIEPLNPIGSGDCLAAGIAWSLRGGRRSLEAVRLGVAAAVENARTLLPARLDPLEVVRRAGEVVVR